MKLTQTLALLLSLFSFTLLAQEGEGNFKYDNESKSVIPTYIGKVILVKGEVKNQKGEVLKKDAKVFPKDIVTTTKNGLVKFELVDTTIMTLGPKSSLDFKEWIYKTKSDRSALFNLTMGKLRAHFKVKAKKEGALKIKAAHVAMGVRGTEIVANHLKQMRKGKPVTVAHFATLEGETLVYDEVKDIEIEQSSGQQYISYLDNKGKIIKSDAYPLNQKDWDHLNAKDKNPRKYFKPLLKTTNIGDQEISAMENSILESRMEESNRKRKRRGKKKPSWRDTLNRLNEAYQEEEL